MKNQELSRYCDWFYIRKFPVEVSETDAVYECVGDYGYMPKLNTANPEVQVLYLQCDGLLAEQSIILMDERRMSADEMRSLFVDKKSDIGLSQRIRIVSFGRNMGRWIFLAG
ncbi:MAG: hypothetical protein ACLTUL_02330 [Blautia faecis]